MEDVLEVYKRPVEPRRPLICMDEVPKQLLADIQAPQPAKAGKPVRYDYEYRRQGVANLFMFFEPFQGQRHIQVTQRCTRQDRAQAMRQVADELYPQADKIVVVLDNLNTHTPAAFYEAFEPAEARRLVERFEFHFTPKHGSWLNTAEIELSVLDNAWIAGYPIWPHWIRKFKPGRCSAILKLLRSIGCFPPPRPGSS